MVLTLDGAWIRNEFFVVVKHQLWRDKLTAIIAVECINAKEIFVSKTLTCIKARGKKTNTRSPAAQFL